MPFFSAEYMIWGIVKCKFIYTVTFVMYAAQIRNRVRINTYFIVNIIMNLKAFKTIQMYVVTEFNDIFIHETLLTLLTFYGFYTLNV